jgi:hypothetical protein
MHANHGGPKGYDWNLPFIFFLIHYKRNKTPNPYLRMEEARRLRASALWALASATRLATS